MIYSKIEKYCKENNISIAVGSNAVLEEYREVLNKKIPFINSISVQERIDPKMTMENCNSIILVGVPYPIYKSSKDVGELSHNSFIDYHNSVRIHLENILQILNDKLAVYNVDTGKLFERGFALKYGLGFKGLNTFIINDELGSYFNIGYILTSLKFEETETLNKSCFECHKCIDVCPTKALNDGNCNLYTCASYLTQKKGLLKVDEIPKIGNFLYGCDKCQKICPHNKNITLEKNEFNINAFEILKMNKKDFLQYKSFGFYWRGLGVIKRNAIYNIYNSSLSNNEKLEIFNNQLEIEKMELPIKTLKQVIDMLNV